MKNIRRLREGRELLGELIAHDDSRPESFAAPRPAARAA